MKTIRVAVTGAAGQIGYALLFRMASGQMFGPKVHIDLHLIELTRSLPVLKAVAMELEDCAFPLLDKVICTDDLAVGMADIQWAVLVGAMPRKAGMERSDLLRMNADIFAKQGAAINQYADPDAKVFVVGNPCNTNAYIAMKHAPSIPKRNFFAMTMLDENRAKAQVAIKAGVAVQEVQNMTLWGNHSATQFPNFYAAKVNDQEVSSLLPEKWLISSFLPLVQQRGAAVIKAKGSSSAASAANAALESVAFLSGYKQPGSIFSVGLCSQGEYGFPEGLIISYPCRWIEGQIMVDQSFELNDKAKTLIEMSIKELLTERDAINTS